MDPSMLGGMAEMFKNPEMMKSMEAMMENPEMQKMLNDPNMISNMMGILGNAGINVPREAPVPNQSDEVDEVDEDIPELEIVQTYDNNTRVVLQNLKKEIYNNLEGTILEYDKQSERYIVLLDDEKKLSVREVNLRAADELEIVD